MFIRTLITKKRNAWGSQHTKLLELYNYMKFINIVFLEGADEMIELEDIKPKLKVFKEKLTEMGVSL